MNEKIRWKREQKQRGLIWSAIWSRVSLRMLTYHLRDLVWTYWKCDYTIFEVYNANELYTLDESDADDFSKIIRKPTPPRIPNVKKDSSFLKDTLAMMNIRWI